MWREIADCIKKNHTFVVTTHIHPEGDAIGSEIALACFLRDLGKDVTIINSSSTPKNNAFLDPQGTIRVYPEDFSDSILESADAVFIVDVNNWEHLGPFADALRRIERPRVCIDHHVGGDDDIAGIIVNDTTAAAAGVLIYELIGAMNGEVTPAIAEAVYATIITDTGTFRFSNTDERVFRIAGELLHMGVDPFAMHRAVFNKSLAAVKLLGTVLNTLRTTDDGRIAWIHVTQKMFDADEADYEDSDGILDVVRAISGVEYCLFFKEGRGGNIKVSLRSNGNVDVYAIAKAHGGGGHRMAAGMRVEGPIEAAMDRVIRTCREQYGPPNLDSP